MWTGRWFMGAATLLTATAAVAQVLPCMPSPAQYRRAVSDRAIAIGRDIAANTRLFQAERTALERTFGQKPKPTIDMFGRDNARAMSSILDAARRTGMDPEILTAAMAQEGLDAVLLHYPDGTPIDGFQALGVDGFATDMALLHREGFLRRDYDGIDFVEGFADKNGKINVDAAGNPAIGPGNAYWVNEAGHVYRAFAFKNLDAAAEGMAAYLKYKQSLFFRDARLLGIDVPAMTSLQIAAWTYIYYNGGEGTGIKLLRRATPRGVIGRYAAREHHALRNANRIMAAITQYRSRNLFPDPAVVGNCPQPPRGSNASRNAETNGGVGETLDSGGAQGAGMPRE